MDIMGLIQRIVGFFQNTDINTLKEGLGDLLSDPGSITLESLYQKLPKEMVDGLVNEVLKEIPGASDNEIVSSILSKIR